MKNSIILFLLFLAPIILNAQDIKLFEPLNYQDAIKNGTRSREGKPGPDYWQNHSDYDIKIQLDTATHRISGEETVTYFNESSDTLKSLVIRLYPNLFKKGTIRNRATSGADTNDGETLDAIKINNKKFELTEKNSQTNGTNLLITLDTPLPPNEKLDLWCTWNYTVPVFTGDRVGYYKDDAWFLGYFYPQIAVYDDLENYRGIGWDYMLFHTGIQQFYNDFNNFKISIEVPKGFYVWGTGTLTNEKELYPNEIQKRLNEARSSDDIIHILKKGDAKKYAPKNNIWNFEAKHVCDIAYGTSASYLWDGTSVQLSDRRVLTDAVYHPDSKLYHLVAGFVQQTIDYASKGYPQVEFPYEHATVFNGKRHGGMEFPMIANNAEVTDTTSLQTLTFHEVFHNYTPFMMGYNEKRYGFMDEGMTEFYTGHFQINKMKKPYRENGSPEAYYSTVAKTYDAPLIYSTSMENRYNTGLLDYVKPKMVYNLFAQMVGEENYKKAMQVFMERWRGKHPTPWDYFYTINDALGENYNWFWKAWFFDYAYADLGLKLDGKKLIVERVGVDALPVPVNLLVTYKNGTVKKLSRSMKVWKYGAKEIAISLEDFDSIESISVDKQTVPDVNEENNKVTL